MKVYMVLEEFEDQYTIGIVEKVFDSMEKAEGYLKSKPEDRFHPLYVEEWDVE